MKRKFVPYPDGFIGPVQLGERSYILGRVVIWIEHLEDGQLYGSWEA